MKKQILACFLAILMLLCMTACGSASDGQISGNYEPPKEELSDGISSLEGTTVSSEETTRKIVKNGSLSLESTDFPAAVAEIDAAVEAVGGYIQSSRVSGAEGERYASYVVRVPQAQFEAFFAKCATKSTVLQKITNSKDITEQYSSVKSHLNALRTQEQRLIELLAQAPNVDAILQIEKELADVRYQIETYQTALNRYDAQVTFSEIDITLNEVTRAGASDSSFFARIGNALSGSIHAFGNFLEGSLVVLIYLAPFLAVAAVVVIVIFIVHKRKRNRQSPKQEQKRD